MRASTSTPGPTPPPLWEERLSCRYFATFAPRLAHPPHVESPAALAPFADVAVPRNQGRGPLAATWYETAGARGAVLLLHPWVSWGRAYFHRRGRIEALRAAGYHALALDLAGFGESGPPAGFHDHDVEAGLAFLRARVPGLPLHLWGISSGGYWAHPVLSRDGGVAGAMFEDVAVHLLAWSWRMDLAGPLGYRLFPRLFPRSHRFLDLRRHAPLLRVRAAAYVSGERDRGVLPDETRELAALASARCLVVPGAGHLTSIKVAPGDVIDLALQTFALAAEGRPAGPGV